MQEREDIKTYLQVTDPVDVRRVLAHEVERVLAGQVRDARAEAQVVRVGLPTAAVDAFQWLHLQSGVGRWYWSGREEGQAVAATGVADVCAATAPLAVSETPGTLEALRAHLSPVLASCDPAVRYYGGFRFDPRAAAEPAWQPFGAYHFVLPRFELQVTDTRTTLACNLVLPRDRGRRAEILAAIEALPLPAEPLTGELPLPVRRDDHPTESGWHQNIAWVLEAFRQGTLGKVVLARRATFGFEAALEPLLLLKYLQSAAPNRFHFCFQPDGESAFIGASPERLFRRAGRQVWSEAVAGTRPRGDTDTADALLLDELLMSEKDQREHDYVRRSIRDALAALCDTYHVDTQASEMRLARGRHLVSQGQGLLRPGVTTLDILEALHPTPAVGGFPQEASRQAIAQLEPFDRGWYAGPVGWIGPDAAEFAVAIRSGLAHEGRLALYSGAGIVEGSQAASEWDEIEQKIVDFVKVLGLDLRRTR